jgi:hypothetical protein
MAASKFTAVVDVPLTAAQTAAIDKAIQGAVLQQVARLDNGVIGRRLELGIRTPGIQLKSFATLDALKKNGAFRKVALKK